MLGSSFIAPIPDHVDIGWVDGNEQPCSRDCTSPAGGWTDEGYGHGDFGDTTYICPEIRVRRKPGGDNFVKKRRGGEMHDSGEAEKEGKDFGEAVRVHSAFSERTNCRAASADGEGSDQMRSRNKIASLTLSDKRRIPS